jgi:FkbM family methyltransferase
MPRFDKALATLVRPVHWPSLLRGVVPGIEHAPAFKDMEFATVIDVGANKGQFAAFAQARWPGAQLVCFEPLPGPRRRLEAVTGGRAEVHAFALGAVDGEAQMHIASREDSSSLLPLGDTQKRLFSMTEDRTAPVPVRRLDGVVKKGALAQPSLLKIDVQGFEYEVLQGASGLLGAIDSIYVECSSVELYSGQRLAQDIAAFLAQFGFMEQGRFNRHIERGVEIQSDLLFKTGVS